MYEGWFLVSSLTGILGCPFLFPFCYRVFDIDLYSYGIKLPSRGYRMIRISVGQTVCGTIGVQEGDK